MLSRTDKEKENTSRGCGQQSQFYLVMKDTRCSNTPENMLVEERKQEHQILQTCFYSSHL